MTVHDQMREKFREDIARLCSMYSYGDRSRQARAVVLKIESLERARFMWGLSWSRYKDQGEEVALQRYIIGTVATIRAVKEGRKGVTSGWEAALGYAEDLLRKTSA